MQTKDIMHTGIEFVTANAPLRTAAEIMSRNRVGFLPVREGGQIVGVVTDRDLAIRPAEASRPYDATVVADVMSRCAHAVRSDAPIAGVVSAMKRKAVQRLLVLNENEELVGVVCAHDVVARADPQLAGSLFRSLMSRRSGTLERARA